MYIYLFIYRFVWIYGTVNGVNLFTMPGMLPKQRVVYANSLKVFAATSCRLLFIAMNRIKILTRRLSTT